MPKFKSNKKRCKMLKAFAKEEEKSASIYNKLGFKEQAKDESKHAKFFKKLVKEKC